MCTSVERTAVALLRLSQDRDAMKRRTLEENRDALGLKAPSAMDRASAPDLTVHEKNDHAFSAASRAREALEERGDRIQSISNKTTKMREDAENFATMAAKLRQQSEAKSIWPF